MRGLATRRHRKRSGTHRKYVLGPILSWPQGCVKSVLDLGPTFQIGFRFVVTPLTLQIRRNAAKLLAATLTAVTAVALVVPPAGADQAQQSYQLSTERVEAQNLASQISALGQREAALGEQYDAGVVSLQQANTRVLGATRALTSAKASQAKTVVLLRVDAVSAYVGGGPRSSSLARCLSPTSTRPCCGKNWRRHLPPTKLMPWTVTA